MAADIGQAMYSILTQSSGITAMVANRCYPEILPQNPQYPAVLMMHLNNTVDNHLQGDSGLRRSRFQIESWASTMAAAISLAGLVSAVLKNYSGTVGSVRIGTILQLSENPNYEPEIKVFRILQDYHVWYDI